MARYNVDLQDNEGNAYQIMANPDSVAEFSPAANRENIRSGETYRVIFGKIMKYLSGVGNAAYVGMANNCTTTMAGFALDARQGKELMDRINELNRDLSAMNDNGAITGMDAREDGVYITYSTGADTVTKKLGSSGIGGTLETVAVRDRTVMTRNYIFNNTGDYVSLVLNVKTPPNGGNANSVTVYGTAIGTSTYKQIQKITTLNADVTVNIKGYDHIKLAVTASHSGNVGHSYEATTITTYALS